MSIDLGVANATAIVTVAVGVGTLWLMDRQWKQRHADTVIKEIARLDHRLSIVETKIDVFWSNIDKYLAKIVHSPHTPELDALLERYLLKELNPSELRHLSVLLNKTEHESALRKNAMLFLKERIDDLLAGMALIGKRDVDL